MIGSVQRAERSLLRLRYLLWQRPRHNRLALERIGGLDVVVLPQVMNPRIFRTGAYFAQVLRDYPLRPDQTVLDMGCGSGVMALTAAQRARRVLAVDINPMAVRCTRINAQLNHLDHRIEARQSDLFSALAAQQFDLLLFNPPFFRGEPQPGFDQAWRSVDTVERFAAQLQAHLKPSGAALLILSSHVDTASFLALFAAHRMSCEPLASRRFLGERLTVYRFSPQKGG